MVAEDKLHLFEPGELTDDGLFALVGRAPARPTSPTMSKAEVREWLGIGHNDLRQAATRQTIRRISPGRYLTSSVTAHLPGSHCANLAQTCAVIGRSPSWLRQNFSRTGLQLDVVGATYRISKASVNKVAVQLRRVDDSRMHQRALRSLNALTPTEGK